ncbi:MAG TPA: YdeI/OmpD-associated family protein [Solirubrobacteraceae bacterium]|nr:YdeI/OmpD-associated family protein [Solirubrobacteraceae bacterium]
MGSIRFNTTLLARGPAAALVLDEDQVAAVGEGAKRFPVQATINGYSWRTSVTRMRGEFLLGLRRLVRDGAGVAAGDTVDVLLELDTPPREVEVPAALVAALAGDAQARVAFEGLAYTHHKEYARWIAEAKREETAQRRLSKAIEMLRDGRTLSSPEAGLIRDSCSARSAPGPAPAGPAPAAPAAHVDP